jgi:hypothetical protein
MNVHALADSGHQPTVPRAGRRGTAVLLFGVFGAPFAWIVQLVVDYALATPPCYAGSIARIGVAPGSQHAWIGLLAINVLAILVAIAATLVSLAGWRAAAACHDGTLLREARIGRVRFLSAWGLMTGLGFAAAIVFTAITVLMVPQCYG